MSLQRVLGLALLLASGVFAAAAFRLSFGEPLIGRILVAACPFAGMLGLAMILLQSPYQERADRGEDMWEMSGLRLVTRRWWMVVFAAAGLAAGGYFVPPEYLGPRAGLGVQSAHIDGAKK